MIHFADYFNARVCINLNKRSFEKVAFKSLKNISDAIVDKHYSRAKHAWISACGQSGSVDEKRWIIDVDEKGRDANDMILFVERQCRPEGEKYVATIPSKNGYHIITTPFDLKYFSWYYPGYEVHKNNPTNLYIP